MRKRLLCFILAFSMLLPMAALADQSEYELRSSEAIIKFIKRYEGFSATAYEDSGGWAIGYGTHIDPADYPDGITEAEADLLMRHYLSNMEVKLDAMEEKLGISLSQNQYDALASLTFNIGTGWLTGEYGIYNMLAYGIEKYPDMTILNTFGNYSHVGEVVYDQLVWRRLAEAKILLYSDYLTGGTQNYEYDLDYEAESHVTFKPEGGLTYCRYTDINAWEWYYRYVSPLTYSGVLEGYDDGSFRPAGTLTCGEALKLICLAAGYPAQDETGEHWAAGYYDLGIDEGFLHPADMTNLDAPITRLLMAELTARALKLPPSSTPSRFTDTSNGYVMALYDAGLVEGSEDGQGGRVFLPNDSLTRAEMCAIVWRIRNGET